MLEINHASPPATFVADAVTTDVVGETDVEEENVATGVVVGNDELNEELTGAADSEVVSTAVLETATLVAEISTELV